MRSKKTRVLGNTQPLSISEQKPNRRCAVFNCNRRHGNTCCADCVNRASCKNPCLNNPQRCGQVKAEVVGNEER
ncbi:hypothetical protein [Anaerotignum sp.]|uniref:hypothetical protein n=1 Tax=Anaerotignum sp. TaxID=2039241 RepID=UPI0028AEC3D2|nr:hypothetical protein [Anaerotignum sp.]